MDRTEAAPVSQSQSRLSPVLLWVLLAAILFRIVTAVMDRGGAEGTGPRPLAAARRRGRAGRESRQTDPLRLHGGVVRTVQARSTGTGQSPEIADRVNAGFVPVRIVDRAREDGRNAPDVDELQRRYEISGFPTLVVAAPDGRLIGKHEGYRNRAALVDFLKEPGRP